MKSGIRKGIFLLLSVFLLVFPYSVSAQSEVIQDSELYTFTYEENTDLYQKIKILNNETQSVEYVESVKSDDGQYIYIVTIDDEQLFEIESVEEKTIITNLKSGEVKTFKTNDLATEIGITPFSNDQGGGGSGTSWKYLTTMYGSKSLNLAGVGLVAGVLASIYGGPVTGVITNIAAFIVAASIEDVWYKTERHNRVDGNKCYFRDVTFFYSNSNRTNLLGSETYIWSPSRCF